MFMMTILNLLKEVNRLKDEAEIRNSFQSVREEVEILKKDKYEKNAFRYFDFLKWIEKKKLLNKTNFNQ